MSIWYDLLSNLPFPWLQFTFMKNALLAVLLITPLFGLLGTMVVNNKLAFFSDTIGHAALTGIAIGVLLGFQNPLLAMLFFAAGIAVAVTAVKNITRFSPDTVIGVFSATAVALGIVILSRNGGFNRYTGFLIGDILSISPWEIAAVGGVLLAVILLWVLMFNKLLLASLNPALARSRGIPVLAIEMIFTVLIAIVVTVAIRWVGILVINSLLILPAAASRNMALNMKGYHRCALGISIFAGISGLILSYYWGTATGATIVLCTAVIFIFSLLAKIKSA
ncbi:MAG: metal ABC transporter permease [Peptococcaceae bacterium]|nr:metal ABC transporter permease [Peptococcaceae bacterium]